MTINIELSDASIRRHQAAFIEARLKNPTDTIDDCLRIAFAAALEAMVEEGTAFEASGRVTGRPPLLGFHVSEEDTSNDESVLIIRLGDKP